MPGYVLTPENAYENKECLPLAVRFEVKQVFSHMSSNLIGVHSPT